MQVGLLGTGVAVVLSVALVRGVGPVPSLGLTGAGISMLGATAVERFAAQVALRRTDALADLPLTPGRPDLQRIVQQAKVGIPLAGTVLAKFAVMGVLTFAAARLGTRSVAVQSVCVALSNLLYTVAVAIGQATVPLVAGHIRADDQVRARRTVTSGLAVALAAVAVLGTALVLLHRQIIPVFSSDPSVRAATVSLLPVLLAAVVTDALQAVAGFGLVGLKRTIPSLLSTLLWFGLLGLSAIPVADHGGLVALWLALTAANLLQAVTKFAAFRRHSAPALSGARPAGSEAATALR